MRIIEKLRDDLRALRSQLHGRTRLAAWWNVLRRTWSDVLKNELLTRASAIAFTAMMTAVPFLALVLTLAALLLPDQTGSGTGIGRDLVHHIEQILGTVLPAQATQIIEDQIVRLQERPPIGIMSISLGATIWLAAGLFHDVIDALNRIYGVRERRAYWKLRILTTFMTFVQVVVVLLCAGAIFYTPTMLGWFGLAGTGWLATSMSWFFGLLAILGSFALTYSIGPDVEQARRWVTPGSLFGALVFILATLGFRYYVANWAQYDTMYGSLGGVIILMFWFWISSLVFLVGGQLNKVFHYAREWSEPDSDDPSGPPKK